MDAVDAYMTFLERGLEQWRAMSPKAKAVVIRRVVLRMEPTGTSMMTALGAMTLQALDDGKITVSKITVDRNGGL